jgi:hypothetical protein
MSGEDVPLTTEQEACSTTEGDILFATKDATRCITGLDIRLNINTGAVLDVASDYNLSV